MDPSQRNTNKRSHTSIYLIIYLPIYPSTYVPNYLPIYLSTIHPSTHPPIYRSVRPSIYTSIHASIYPSSSNHLYIIYIYIIWYDYDYWLLVWTFWLSQRGVAWLLVRALDTGGRKQSVLVLQLEGPKGHKINPEGSIL